MFCRLFLDRGVQVDTRDSSGRTPLSHSEREDICELLLNRGAAVDAADFNRRTPRVALCWTRKRIYLQAVVG